MERNADALHLLGLIQYQSGHAREAAALIGEALQLDPANAAAHGNMGCVRQTLGEFKAAMASFDRAIALDARYFDGHYNRANLRKDLGCWAEALADYDQAIAVKPNFAQAHNNRGAVLEKLAKPDESLLSYERAIAADENFAAAHLNRGVLLHALGRYDEALASSTRAIAIRPDYAEAHAARGAVLRELRCLQDALQSFDRALAIKPDYADAHSNRGVVLHELGQSAVAIASFDRAIAISPAHPRAHFNKSMSCLLEGDFERGWHEHEWRWRTAANARDAARFSTKPWLGEEAIDGRILLLHAEKGLGDTLQFCRYARHVADRGAAVILEVQEPLRTLLSGLDGVTTVLARGESLPSFDYHCPILSLPLAMGTTLATIPARVPYIVSDACKRREWQARLGPKQRRRVGLVWAGGFRPDELGQMAMDRRRNMPLALYAALEHRDIEFVSLQKGRYAECELAQIEAKGWAGPVISQWSDLLMDFSDTAALVEQLDLVISVDTSTAHLAGAMGKPVWLLNRFDTCWRWLRARPDSPWYPSMRIFRQERDGDWPGVMEQVRAALHEWVAS